MVYEHSVLLRMHLRTRNNSTAARKLCVKHSISAHTEWSETKTANYISNLETTSPNQKNNKTHSLADSVI